MLLVQSIPVHSRSCSRIPSAFSQHAAACPRPESRAASQPARRARTTGSRTSQTERVSFLQSSSTTTLCSEARWFESAMMLDRLHRLDFPTSSTLFFLPLSRHLGVLFSFRQSTRISLSTLLISAQWNGMELELDWTGLDGEFVWWPWIIPYPARRRSDGRLRRCKLLHLDVY